jgi:hypothetical protein
LVDGQTKNSKVKVVPDSLFDDSFKSDGRSSRNYFPTFAGIQRKNMI